MTWLLLVVVIIPTGLRAAIVIHGQYKGDMNMTSQ